MRLLVAKVMNLGIYSWIFGSQMTRIITDLRKKCPMTHVSHRGKRITCENHLLISRIILASKIVIFDLIDKSRGNLGDPRENHIFSLFPIKSLICRLNFDVSKISPFHAN